MEEKDFHQALKVAIESSNAQAVERACVNLSFSNTIMFLGQKEKLKLLSKNTDEKFVTNLLYFLNNKKNEENQRYPNHIDLNGLYGDHSKYSKGSNFQLAEKKYVERFKKSKDIDLESFKNSVFVGLIGGLKSDDVKYLKVLDLYWPDRKNVNQLAKKCGAEGFINITHKLLSEFKKPKADSRYQININYFLKNVVKEASVEFLDVLWKTYSRDMKQVFQFLRSHDQFWMHELPKTDTDMLGEIKYQRTYSTDPEIFNIKSFTYEKLMWFEERGIGLKQCNYKDLDLYLPAMQSTEIASYINTNPEVISQILKGYLAEREKDPSWMRPSRDNAFPEVLSFRDKLSKVVHETSLKIFHDSLSNSLQEKPIAKAMKI